MSWGDVQKLEWNRKQRLKARVITETTILNVFRRGLLVIYVRKLLFSGIFIGIFWDFWFWKYFYLSQINQHEPFVVQIIYIGYVISCQWSRVILLISSTIVFVLFQNSHKNKTTYYSISMNHLLLQEIICLFPNFQGKSSNLAGKALFWPTTTTTNYIYSFALY